MTKTEGISQILNVLERMNKEDHPLRIMQCLEEIEKLANVIHRHQFLAYHSKERAKHEHH